LKLMVSGLMVAVGRCCVREDPNKVLWRSATAPGSVFESGDS